MQAKYNEKHNLPKNAMLSFFFVTHRANKHTNIKLDDNLVTTINYLKVIK